jgi:photosystem II stability/assembly factor-like uncharacterized protein
MKETLGVRLLIGACALIAACSGSGVDATSTAGGGANSKSSILPLVVDLQASPSPAWLNATVTFTVTCVGVVGNSNLSYQWDFGDGTHVTSVSSTEQHAYTSGGTSYQYSVTCVDGSNGSTELTAPQELPVYAFDLSEVASGTCSTGKRGLGWCWQYPVPTGANLKTVSAISSLAGWTAGDAGAILATTDGGITWSPKYASTTLNFLGSHSPDHDHVSLIAADASVWTSENAGVQWTHVNPSTGPMTLTHASMGDSLHIWAIDSGSGIVATSDGGNHWNLVVVAGSLPSETQFNAISAASDAKTVWAVGNGGSSVPGMAGPGVAAFTSDGINWSLAPAPPPAPPPPPPVLQIPETAPNGLTLNSVSVTTASRCAAGAPESPSVWIAALQPGGPTQFKLYPEQGLLTAESTDNGKTWNSQLTGGGSLITAFDANNAWQSLPYRGMQFAATPSYNDGFGVTTTGNGAPASVTVDNVAQSTSTSWQYANPTYPFYDSAPLEGLFPQINAMDSADCHSGWAVGNRGTILATQNSGTSWIGQAAAQNQFTGGAPASNFISLLAVNGKQAYALAVDAQELGMTASTATSYAQIFSTVDGGVTWLTQVPMTYTIQFQFPGTAAAGALPMLTRGQIAGNSAGDIVAVGPGFVISKPSSPDAGWHYGYGSTISDELANALNHNEFTPTSWGYETSFTNVLVPNSANTLRPSTSQQTAYALWLATPSVYPNQAYEIWKSVSVSDKSAWVIDGLGNVLEQNTPINNPSGSYNPWVLVAAAPCLVLANQQSAPCLVPCPVAASPCMLTGSRAMLAQPAKQPPAALELMTFAGNQLGWNAIAATDLASGVVAVMVGDGGYIARSADMGMTWATIPAGTSTNLNAVNIVSDGASAGVGWAVGDGGTMLRTTDGGATWTSQTAEVTSVISTNVNLTSISTQDGTSAWALGQQQSACTDACSVLIRTTDGGSSWVNQVTGATGLNSVVSVDPNTGWLTGLNATILKTVTGGQDITVP